MRRRVPAPRRAPTDEVIYRQFRRGCSSSASATCATSRSVAAALRDADIVVQRRRAQAGADLRVLPVRGGADQHRAAPRTSSARSASTGLPVETVVGISTDKACKPVNVMGMTKAIQERIFVQANIDCPGTRFVCVRYGNVIASRGSVVPLFHEQIRARRAGHDHDGGDDPVPAQPRPGGRHDASPRSRRGTRARPTSRARPPRAIVDIADALIGDRDDRRSRSPASGPARRSTRSWSREEEATAPSSAATIT